jgi:hypothetical protein
LLQGQCPTSFGVLGPPAGIPHRAQMQYCAPKNLYGNLLMAHSIAAPFLNIMKKFANWNVCYSCSFDVENGHTSMTCPSHLRKASHAVYFTRQNIQQYIALGLLCCTKNRHKARLPST